MLLVHLMSLTRRSAWSGMLAVALLLGAALIASAATGYRRMVEVAETMAQGEGEAHLLAIRVRAPPRAGAPAPQVFEEVYAEGRARGLHFVGLLGPDGRVLYGAGGYAPGDRLELPPEHDAVLRVGSRLRRAPPPPGGPPQGSPPHQPPPPAPGEPLPGPPGGRVVVEFEPILAEAMTAGAARTLAVSLVAAIALMGAAGFLYRMAARAAAAEERMARQRHLASLGEMSAVLAHEIRNPLAALKGHAQLLSEGLPEGARERKRVDRVVHEAQRLEALTTQLLDFARSGQIQREALSPAALALDAAEAVDPARIALHAGEAPATWPLDPARMRQVLINLLTNAIQASPPDAQVELTLGEASGRLELAIRDRGAGIPPGEEERIFEPFHTTRVRGTGLGLAVARRIVELHGGSLRAENHAGGGAVFRVSIPRA